MLMAIHMPQKAQLIVLLNDWKNVLVIFFHDWKITESKLTRKMRSSCYSKKIFSTITSNKMKIDISCVKLPAV